ncbi:MupA/Atu3671 family FMN-dependent luciferase-like monooxygenase [Archangium lansingense]|uniref:MupA/Atu3671 family FMN-dependent luciferase-like monooxygenase n=1 Tax=Archangium lansingense TaxID=2995310 RepID=UPI003B7B3C98
MKNVEDAYKLSPPQRELLTWRQPALETRLEHLCWSFRGPLDEGALEQALKELVRRHTVLRTAFFTQGLAEPMQVVREKVSAVLERVELPHVAEPERAEQLAAWLEEDRRRGMNLTAAPLVRLTLLRTAPESGTLVFGYHPLVLDVRSAHLCLEELLRLFQAMREKTVGTEAPEKPRPYREYLAWLEQQGLGELENHFRHVLREAQPTLLPESPAAGAAEGTPTHQVQQLVLTPAASGAVQLFLRRNKLSLATLVQSAWALLLRPYASGGDVLFGVLVPGRPTSLPRGESMLGCFAHMRPWRVAVPADGNTLRWLRGQQAELTGRQRDPSVSLAQVRSWLGLPEDAPLFQSAVTTWESPEENTLEELGRSLGLRSLHPRVLPLPFPLTVEALSGERLTLRLHHDPRRFSALKAIHLVGRLGALLETLATQPDQDLSSLLRELESEKREPVITAGARVEVAELQTLLAQHPAVREVAVRAEGSELVAHVVPVSRQTRKLDFSLFFFADEDDGASDKYRLLMEAGKFADRHGFRAIWTPERHFHPHGGLYPNPSVLAAALSSVTENIQLRAGSVVLPLQSPFRVVEEWSIVDNLSRGRAGLSVVSGWVPNDFALAPENFARKRDILFERLEQVERLWRGEAIPAKDGAGNEVQLRVFPRPVQPKLPLWVTCSTDPGLFEKTGTLGYHVLTSVIGQSLDEALEKLGLYGAALTRAGHRREEHITSLMMHAFVGRDADEVLDKVRGPLTSYLRAHVALMQTLVKSLELQVDINQPQWLDYLASYAFERYYRTGALIGTVTSCLPMVDRLMTSGVDEVACLIDFGVDVDAVLEGLTHLAELKRLVHDDALRMERVLTESLEERLPGRRPAVRFRLVEALP